ncbi:hypothetical protein LIER_22984 [Lithospermum erythrorhizon]|uniref:Uncharacterized protein n=1 Tax=Lithospermum erythrorhizon TaxID=34254 RepID=A0AAV3QX27_LITER
MNSNYGKSNSSSGSLGSFDFDLGLNSGRSRPLNDQKGNSNTTSYMYTSSQSRVNTSSGGPNRLAWTHQAAAPAAQMGWGASLAGPTSMVGDIFGKSWGSTGGVKAAPPPVAAASSIGMAKKDPNLFGDLVNSALGQNKGGIGGGGGNAPLKNANPAGNKNVFSVGGMADSLPKSGASGGSWGSNDSFGSFTSGYSGNQGSGSSNVNLSGGTLKDPKLGSGIGMKTNQDPFGNLVNMSAKPSGGMNIGSKANNNSSATNDPFGAFQDAGKTSGSAFPSSATSNNSAMGSSTSGAYSKMDDFGAFNTSSQTPVQPGSNDFDALFASSTASAGGTAKASEGLDTQQFEGGDDWGFHGSDDTSGTTELEGLPPPPAGVSGSMAKTKGMDNYKGGQFADAIKWLSWAVILLEKAGDDAGTTDVLSNRASCYKEVGEYKKAVADCSKILEQNGDNVDVLVQRALLYESMEKYKLGAEDLRKVMNLDPSNRVARSTIHRLTKMAAAC